jgi:hypothetical protein
LPTVLLELTKNRHFEKYANINVPSEAHKYDRILGRKR